MFFEEEANFIEVVEFMCIKLCVAFPFFMSGGSVVIFHF